MLLLLFFFKQENQIFKKYVLLRKSKSQVKALTFLYFLDLFFFWKFFIFFPCPIFVCMQYKWSWEL